MTGLIASIVEAYGELRVNKGRILLSLIGVAFSVFALTAVLSGGGMLQQAIQQSTERFNGRSATIEVDASAASPDTDQATLDRTVLEQFDQLGITERTRELSGQLRLQTGSGVVFAGWRGVDPAWGEMHRTDVVAGRWFADSDQARLAPALVVDQTMYDMLGRPALGSETVDVVGEGGVTLPSVVIGVVPAQDSSGMYPALFSTAEAATAFPAGSGADGTMTTYFAWVPPEQADAVVSELNSRLANTPAGAFSSYRSDYNDELKVFSYIRWAIIGVALVILVLGAMGLVNIALVTIRYRVREIGIRRSYGATGMRVFVGVLMESVVATVIAGVVGVTAAVALVKAPFVTDFFHAAGLVDIPPFPTTAVLIGLLAATIVGVLAGALPALIATRIKVIDAIRS
ncbi:ABC transporter permease [Brachybacterium huguangmaarense]|uniref:ABC transporter permease n=1 Tax=Brachybacterium huguangmaarense TaxID=1652028 RepID=A0ABY6G2V0_9MICO|nr:ABC transporter permease [Brachybacterium huguangmaarense]UYG17447.1 ABC transporter permease [Brachybacterium huguangmaarense]